MPAACGENSSSATLDIPAGARVVAARLYVDTTLSTVVSPVRARLDGPAPGFDYTELSTATPGIPKLGECAGSSGRGSRSLRQAVWDVTSYVQAAGAGSYTVADIIFERAGAFLPYASWAHRRRVRARPGGRPGGHAGGRPGAASPTGRSPGTTASSSRTDGSVDVAGRPASTCPSAGPPFAKAFHLVAHAQHRGADNLLFAGQPLGNNDHARRRRRRRPASPSAPIRPATRTTDILNDSICVLGHRWRRSRRAPPTSSPSSTARRRRPARASTSTSPASPTATSSLVPPRRRSRCSRAGGHRSRPACWPCPIDLPAC